MKIGHRHYNNLIKELIWFIQENWCEIILTIASIVCIYFIGKAWICHLKR